MSEPEITGSREGTLRRRVTELDEGIERLSAELRATRAEELRLRLQTQELSSALRDRQESFLDILDRLQEREEEAVRRARAALRVSEARFQLLVGPADGAPHFALRRFIMEQGGGIPMHTNQVEHEQYVLRGRATVRIGDDVHQVGPDNALYIPAGTPHSYEVIEGPFEFICVVPNLPDEIKLQNC